MAWALGSGSVREGVHGVGLCRESPSPLQRALASRGTKPLTGVPSPQATATNRTKYYVSHRRDAFVLMKLPKYALPKVRGSCGLLRGQVRCIVQVCVCTCVYLHVHMSSHPVCPVC